MEQSNKPTCLVAKYLVEKTTLPGESLSGEIFVSKSKSARSKVILAVAQVKLSPAEISKFAPKDLSLLPVQSFARLVK